jgi:hypothetical protein
VAGPNRLTLSTPLKTHGENLRTVAEFSVHAGEGFDNEAVWYRVLTDASPHHEPTPVGHHRSAPH